MTCLLVSLIRKSWEPKSRMSNRWKNLMLNLLKLIRNKLLPKHQSQKPPRSPRLQQQHPQLFLTSLPDLSLPWPRHCNKNSWQRNRTWKVSLSSSLRWSWNQYQRLPQLLHQQFQRLRSRDQCLQRARVISLPSWIPRPSKNKPRSQQTFRPRLS